MIRNFASLNIAAGSSNKAVIRKLREMKVISDKCSLKNSLINLQTNKIY